MARKKLTIGIDLGATNIKYGLATLDGKIIISKTCHSPVEYGTDSVLKALIDSGQELIDYASEHKMKVTSIGVGSPGTIDTDNGVVLGTTPNIPDWPGTNIKKAIEKNLQLPCSVDNDANLFLLAESLYGAAKGFSHAIGLTIGTGIGSALLIDGKIYRGSSFVAPEIGHTQIIPYGRECNCGLRGCLEAYANTTAIKRNYINMVKSVKRSISTKDIFTLGKKGDIRADRAIDIWCDHLTTGIASAVNILNPEVVILGGGVAEAGSYLRKKVENKLYDKLIPLTGKNLKVKLAKLGNKAGWLGASALARQR